MDRTRIVSRMPAWIVGLALAESYGIAAHELTQFSALHGLFPLMSKGFLFFGPFAVGVFALFPLARPNWFERLALPWSACALLIATALLAGWEGRLCVTLGLPAILVMAGLGGAATALPRARPPAATAAVLILPFAVSAIESQLALPRAVREVRSHVRVAASPDTVWHQLVGVRPIGRSERRPFLFQWLGLPRPVAATLRGHGVGAIRNARFERGVLFLETVSAWDQDRRLLFSVAPRASGVAAPPRIDHGLRLGGRSFAMLTEEYRLQPLRDGTVRLGLISRYRLSTRFNAYAGPWCDAIVRSVQRYLLAVIRDRAEGAARAAGRDAPAEAAPAS